MAASVSACARERLASRFRVGGPAMLIIGIIPPLVDRSVDRSFGRLPVLAVGSRDAESPYDRLRLFDRVRNLLHQSMCPYGTFVQRSLRPGSGGFRAACLGAEWAGPFPHDW